MLAVRVPFWRAGEVHKQADFSELKFLDAKLFTFLKNQIALKGQKIG